MEARDAHVLRWEKKGEALLGRDLFLVIAQALRSSWLLPHFWFISGTT
jgi:hypothetical protein